MAAGFSDPVLRETVVVGGSLPLGGNPGDVLLKTTVEDFASAWVPPADHAEEDNTRPITAAAVYTEIGEPVREPRGNSALAAEDINRAAA